MHSFLALAFVLGCLLPGIGYGAQRIGVTLKGDLVNALVIPGLQVQVSKHVALEGFYFGGWTDYDGYALRVMGIAPLSVAPQPRVWGYGGVGYARLEQDIIRTRYNVVAPLRGNEIRSNLRAKASGSGTQLFLGTAWAPRRAADAMRLACEVGYALFEVTGSGRLTFGEEDDLRTIRVGGITSDYERLTFLLSVTYYFL